MTPLSCLFADAGPPPGLVLGALVCVAVAAVVFCAGAAGLVVWIVRRNRQRPEE